VRRRARDLRYAGEALTPSLGRRASRLASASEDLQDLLGRRQDAVVLLERVRAAVQGTPWRTAFAAGEVAAGRAQVLAETRADLRQTLRRVRRRRRKLRA
jgi:CHAD domain-containing protein